MEKPVSTTAPDLHTQIQWHEQQSQSQSLLAEGLDCLYRRDDKSLKALKDLEARGGSAEEISKAIEEDNKAMHRQGIATRIGSTIATAAPLFMPGVVGYGLAALTGGLNKASLHEREHLGSDLLLGATSSVLIKSALSKSNVIARDLSELAHIPTAVGGNTLTIALTGTVLGTYSRFLSNVMDRHTFEGKDGNVDFGGGLTRALKNTFNPAAMAVDVASFGIGMGLVGLANGATNQFFTRTPFGATIATGGMFGFGSGVSAETLREIQAKENISVSKILSRGLEQGAVTAIAAVPGGLMSQHAFNVERQRNLEEYLAQPKSHEQILKTLRLPRRVITVDGQPMADDPITNRVFSVSTPEGKLVLAEAIQPGAPRPSGRAWLDIPYGKKDMVLHVDQGLTVEVDGKPGQTGQIINEGAQLTIRNGQEVKNMTVGTAMVNDVELNPNPYVRTRDGKNWVPINKPRIWGFEEVYPDQSWKYEFNDDGFIVTDQRPGQDGFFAKDYFRLNGKPINPSKPLTIMPGDELTHEGHPVVFGVSYHGPFSRNYRWLDYFRHGRPTSDPEIEIISNDHPNGLAKAKGWSMNP